MTRETMADLKLMDASINDFDEIEVSDNESERVTVTARSGRATTVTLLEEAQARELFNWLGIWLHG